MSLKTGPEAVQELLARLGPPPEAGRYGEPETTAPPEVTLPAGFRPAPPESWLWARPQPGKVLRDPAAYDLTTADLTAEELHQAPEAAFAGPGEGPWTPAQERYCRQSADITMRGGTTSGVVYPTAICEIAREFRLRNVGGASAGAIAAAAAAAAEAGRMAADTGTLPGGATGLTAARRRQGHVRAGFAGLADVIAWMAQVDEPAGQAYRLAQLFQPAGRTRPLFRLLVALMRGRLWSLPAQALGAFGWVSRLMVLAGVAGAVATVTLTRPRAAVPAWWPGWLPEWVLGAAAALAALAAPALVLVGALMVAAKLKNLLTRGHGAPELAEPIGPAPVGEVGPAPVSRLRGLIWPLTLLAVGAGLSYCAVQVAPLRVHLLVTGLVWTVLVLLLLAVGAASGLRVLGRGRQLGFGIVPGAAPARKRRSLLDAASGLAKRSVDRPLITWLSDTLAELAGLPEGEVLRFGHLWFGPAYGAAKPTTEELLAAAGSSGRRRINLELMASELVEQLAYRFPLSPQPAGQHVGKLYFRPEDLHRPGHEVLPRPVVDAMIAGQAPITVRDIGSTTSQTFEVYPLPQPWDLPVVFAVRLSLALPVLFQAVRVYRGVGPVTVRDEFGRRVVKDPGGDGGGDPGGGEEVRYPSGDAVWVTELWFTDGGVTSNFPVHFFDSPLPRWPTFGINLGAHPRGFAHQDVWLPQDWQPERSLAAPMPASFLGFLNSVVDTARAWRDNSQTMMPGYRGRVAWVRQRGHEGGANLFMPREVIAALALRGAFAGARLRRRFADEVGPDGRATAPYWRRHQWLRLRTTARNLEELRDVIAVALRDPHYRGAAAGPDGGRWLEQLKQSLAVYDADPLPSVPDPWFTPPVGTQFWPGLAALADLFEQTPAVPALREGTPEPAPVLRQSPPE